MKNEMKIIPVLFIVSRSSNTVKHIRKGAPSYAKHKSKKTAIKKSSGIISNIIDQGFRNIGIS